MRQAGRVVGKTISSLLAAVKPGMSTRDLDELAAAEIKRLGGQPAFLGYRGFPATICTSLNEEIVHGIPGKRLVREGDVLKLDVGAVVDGFYGDSAVSVCVGEAPPRVRELVETTRLALEAGVKAARPGARLGDVGYAVQSVAEAHGFSVVREYVGHGIGRALHEDPNVPNFGTPGQGLVLQPSMTIAIEPMLNIGGWETRLLGDNWTVVTKDGSLSAHFEHTVHISPEGPQVLTAREEV
ncbi:MAG: type I methionyl aminopeptidase [Dehalococcoidia bacterium]|nr:type I methionyl aminopeptidase [Dehalococcoidia bacterium]